ncbi:uroporphyrinogen-III synthase [Virgibacillus sp. W0430]|uniref:uroporphyrinogen-III synthase n=1 Tax=Virgibacillus sp. W0430 TaxID=3391580 RepID=UPI003F464B12
MSFHLQQKKIVITREQKQAQLFSKKIKKSGGDPIEVPLLQIHCKPLEEKQRNLDLSQYDWIIFTSANGVECFFKAFSRIELTASIAVVGHKTEQSLLKRGYRADFIPSIYNAEALAEEFINKNDIVKRVLLVRGNRSLNLIPVKFKKHGIPFDTIEVYETGINTNSNEKLQTHFQTNDAIDFITFTSPSTIDACMQLVNDKHVKENILSTVCVCIGSTTASEAKKAGFRTIIVPDLFTVEGMIKSIRTYLNNERTDCLHGK